MIQRIRYLRLYKELTAAPPTDLQKDRRVLTSRLVSLGYDPSLDDALTLIDERISRATTQIDFKWCMDLLRAFLEQFVKASSARAATIAGSTDRSSEEFVLANQSLVPANITTEEECVVLQKFYTYLSNAGVHRLGSKPEQVRVMRTTVIEWALMLAGRLEDLAQRRQVKKK